MTFAVWFLLVFYDIFIILYFVLNVFDKQEGAANKFKLTHIFK